MEPHRGYSGAGDDRWYEDQNQNWDRGRHGASAPSGGEGAAAGYAPPGDGREPGFLSPGQRPGDAEPSAPPFGAEPTSGPAGSRHNTESIDVGALRRSPISSPPDESGLSYAADYGSAGLPPAAYQGPSDMPLYPPNPGFGHGATDAVAAPTAAVNTVPSAGRPSVYASRKPAVAIAVAVAAVIFEIPAVRLLVAAAFDDVVSVSGIVAGTFLVAGLPLFAFGVYGLLGGAAVDTRPATWLRAPLVYLPLGVLMFLFAALAAA